MAKNVFKPTEITYLTNKVVIEPPQQIEEEAEQVAEIEEYTGPTADDLRREAEAFKKQWEEEKKNLTESTRQEADLIIGEAKEKARLEVELSQSEAEKIINEAQEKAKQIEEDARLKAESMDAEANEKVQEIEEKAYSKGLKAGQEQGYQDGSAEVKRLIDRLHAILSKAIEKRNELLKESEMQIIDLILLIAKKVVKVISENQKNVVINNALEALRKLKRKSEVIIRVNQADLELTTQHTEKFLEMLENAESITVLEDASVGKGGCVIETDFGSIDARISSQLNEIEQKISELVPLRIEGG